DASGDASADLDPPRPIAPLSTARVTSRRPMLRWQLSAGSDGAAVELCRTRACTTVSWTVPARGGSAALTNDEVDSPRRLHAPPRDRAARRVHGQGARRPLPRGGRTPTGCPSPTRGDPPGPTPAGQG